MPQSTNKPRFTPKDRPSTDRIKTVFLSEINRETAKMIRERQQQVADDWALFDEGKLKNWLQGHFSVQDKEAGSALHMRYLTYARFLDMPDERREQRQAKREGYHLYNRIVFGILYNRTLPEMKEGFTAELQGKVGGDLHKAVKQHIKSGYFNS